MRDTVRSHGCDESRVVGLLSRDPMRHDEPAPFWVDIISVRKPKNRTLDAGNNSVRLRRSESESIIF